MYEQFVTVTIVLQRKQEGTSPFGPLSLRSDQRGNIFRNIARATTKNLTLSVPLLRPGLHALTPENELSTHGFLQECDSRFGFFLEF